MRLQRLLPSLARDDKTREAMVDKAHHQAETGRRLAMYDRETGLYAYWYLVRRFEEESHRAERYERPLSVLTAEVTSDDAYCVQDELRDWLTRELRSTDLASHMGDGLFLILLTETDLEDAAAIAARLAERFARSLTIGLGAYPDDGAVLQELQTAAQRRSHDNWQLAV